ncbi:hypothetical protein pb186bvf_008960 [Paramecium bursaria]
MKLLIYQDWLESASNKAGISKKDELKIWHEMYEYARILETNLQNVNRISFNEYFQKGLAFFHRFAHQISYDHFDRNIYLTACMFLAAKDLDMFDWSVERYVKAFLVVGSKRDKDQNPQFDSKLIEKYTKQVLDAESQVLKMLGYDLDIIVPQLYFKAIKPKIQVDYGDSSQLIDMAQKLLSDFFLSNICLYYLPQNIALAAVYKASTLQKRELQDLPNGKPWYQIFDDELNVTKFEDIQEIDKYFNDCLNILKS